MKRREAKAELKKQELEQKEAVQNPNQPKQRGRKPKIRVQEELDALEELRKKRKKIITVLH